MADPKESSLAGKLAIRLRKQHLIYERNHKRWMQYPATYPGVWGELGDDEVAARVDTALSRLCPDGYSARTLDGVIRLLKIRLGTTLPPPSPELLPCRNGALHVPTLKLRRPTPEDHFTWCLPYDYDATATCKAILDWFKEATSGWSIRESCPRIWTCNLAK